MMMIYASHSNAIIVADDLAKIHNWCFENSLIINSKKTYATFLSRNKVNILQQHNNASMILDESHLKQSLRFAIWESILTWLFPLKIT